MEISFANPGYLFLLFLIPLMIIIYFVSLKNKRRTALQFANFDAIARIKGIDLYSKNITSLIITILIMTLIIFSVSGIKIDRIASTSASAFVLAIDVSQSMSADDMSPSRFEAAKSAAIDFVGSLPSGTKVGIVSFAGNSFIEISPTDEFSSVKKTISAIPLSSIGGTDIYEAIITSSNLLEGYEGKSVIIFSDGQLNVGDFQGSLSYALEKSVLIHSIAMGTLEGGNASFGISRLDESSLRAIAFETGGTYFRAYNENDLIQSLAEIVSLKSSRISNNLSEETLLAALVLMFINYFLISTKFREFP